MGEPEAGDKRSSAEPIESPGQQRTELLVGLATIVLGVAILLAVPQLRHCASLVLHGRFTGLRNYIDSLGAGGVALILGLMLLHSVVFFYPSEIVTTTAGYVYGFWGGLGLALVGWFGCALLSYVLGRAVGGPLLQRLLGRRFEGLVEAVDRGGISFLLSARLIPIVPFSLLGYVAGAAQVNLWRFSWTTVVGYLPLTILVALLGSRAQTLSTSDPLLWAAVVALIALVVGERLVRSRMSRREAARSSAEAQPDPAVPPAGPAAPPD
jgi:uncharacterized membrane protein YdjX (TVP38/TMEM64 family)